MILDPLLVLVMADEPVLDVSNRVVLDHDQKRPAAIAAFHHVTDVTQLLLGIAPPFPHMRLAKPAAEQGIMLRLDREEIDLMTSCCPGHLGSHGFGNVA